MQWDNLFAARTSGMKRSTIRHFLKLTNEPGMISFAGGLPAAELLPTDQVVDCVARVMKRFGSSALQYGATEGVSELRDSIAETFSTANAKLSSDNVLIVSGAQQALDMLGRIFFDPDDVVAVENPTYLAALLAWRPLGVKFAAVPGDDDGLDVNALERVFGSKPKLTYVVPNFQNPQGTTMAIDRRERVADLLERHAVPFIEDDPYRELRFDGADLPTIFSLQRDVLNGSIIFVGTFSKVIAPGLRVGWIIAPSAVIEKLSLAKQAMDLHTSTFNQYLVLEMLRSNTYHSRLAAIRSSYRERCDAMLKSLAEHFPSEVTWSRPAGGMFLFARLPERFNAADVLSRAIEQRVIFVPGADFHVNGAGQNTMRLNFTRHDPDTIYEGIRRLGGIVKDVLAKQS